MTALTNKIAVVTGAGSGLGQASAKLLAARGAQVFHADISGVTGSESIHLDVTQEAHWIDAMAVLTERFGGIDILVNAAGVSLKDDAVDICSADTWSRTMAVNLDGTFLGCKHAIPAMRGRGGGSIVNFGSINSLVGDGSAAAYVASKGGVRLLTKSTALHCAAIFPTIRCNLVCPGYVETPMLSDWLAHQPEDTRARLESSSPMKRLGQPADVAALVAYLASDEASSVTGGEFVIDGGFTAR